MCRILICSLIAFLVFQPLTTYAISDPTSVPNNKFGIHIISPVPEEASGAASLVNSSGGDWGYVTFIIESKDRNLNKWQEFFNDLRRRHLIPIIRLATKPVDSYWERPYEKEYEAWADFLDKLNWPIKNRYVVIYNEPNHGQEWGQVADPVSYAKVLNSTIDALKNKSPDFFVMNAGFDQAAPDQPPQYFDEELFLKEMDKTVPGIFNKLDGWSSHSYPNPGFMGLPDASGRGTVQGFLWEMQILRSLGLTKTLPVFITETGWKRSKEINSELVGEYLQTAFQNAWSSSQIMAVTPFLLNYEEPPFENFAFKNQPQYQIMAGLPKQKGQPVQENKAELVSGEVYHSIVAGQQYTIKLEFKNIGQSIWDLQTKLVALQGGKELGIEEVIVSEKIEPQQKYIFNIKLKAPQTGKYHVALNLMNENKVFDSPVLEFDSEVKSPVILQIKAGLNWKKNHQGSYYLETKGVAGESVHLVTLLENGQSQKLEAPFLLPDYNFEFTLSKPYYNPKTIKVDLMSGENILDFGLLTPDILGTLLNPKELWKLLPF